MENTIASTTTAADLGELIARRPRRELPWLLQVHLSMFRTKPLGAFGAALVFTLILAAVLAPVIASSPTDSSLRESLQSPGAAHWFGTDAIGRDLYSRVVYGARVSIAIGFGSVGIGTVVALFIGTIGAYRGGMLDLILQRLVDAWIAIPWLVFLLAAMTILSPGIGSLIGLLAFGVSFANSRIVRSAVISVLQEPYVDAARSLGASDTRIILRHVLPNIMAPVIVVATLGLGNVILAEAALSFLGFGVPPPTPAWGGMLSGSARDYMYIAPWLMIFPGLAIALTVFGFNMYGDALRDLLDPRLRGTG